MNQDEEDFPRPYWVPTKYEAEFGDHIPQGMASARRDLENKSQFVLFVDILGFANLVEEDEKAQVRWAAGLSPMRGSMRHRPPTSLTVMFEKFHYSVENTLQTALNLNLREPRPWRPPAIVFSDSAFIVLPWLNMAIDVARRLMRRLIEAEVPARMGIAFGGFSATRFSTETRGQNTHHVSEFYGTAVVRAHGAESCGIKGMRILLHPSVIGKIQKTRTPQHDHSVNRSTELLLPEPAGRHGVTHELNYLAGDETDDQLRASVSEMKKCASEGFQLYYDETLAAIERMKR